MPKESNLPDAPYKNTLIRRHRSLFLSDLHLGSLGARADLVLHFLEHNRAETYFLVGDILDVALPFSFGRSAVGDAVIEYFHRRQAEGARLVYLIGNHDPAPEDAPGRRRLPVKPIDEIVHVAADGRRYLIVHGHQQDRAIFRNHLLTRIGAYAESFARLLCGVVASARSGRAVVKGGVVDRLSTAINAAFHLGRGHERRLVELARQRGVDGVICGHYHVAGLHERQGLVYANCGDWVTSITCLSEDYSGRLHLVDGRLIPAFGSSLVPDVRIPEAQATRT